MCIKKSLQIMSRRAHIYERHHYHATVRPTKEVYMSRFKQKIILLTILVFILSLAGSALATTYYHGVPSFSSGNCKRRYATNDAIEKDSDENWGNTYCCASGSFSDPEPDYNYLYVTAVDRHSTSSYNSLGARSTILFSAQYGYLVSLNASADDYDDMYLIVSNPYYIANGSSNTVNMVSNGIFWSTWN